MKPGLLAALTLTLALAAPVLARPLDPRPPPPVPADHAADKAYDPAVMDRARAVLRFEHGGMPMSKVMADLFEYQTRAGEAGFRWEGEAWYGGDINRLVMTSAGDGTPRTGLEAAEVQALYSRAVGPFTDLQGGLRQDFKPGPARTYATVGFEAVLPYWLRARGGLYLSTRGDLLGRAEGSYDLRLTQRLILQPRAELNFAAQDMPRQDIGQGLSKAEFGLRLRYELRRELAPYVGVTYDRAFGHTADLARARGEKTKAAGVVMGVRGWF
ncbi:MAG: copper resistance protein CopB [Phenylobacterium zucineum]|nr:MAG: copper resistance protein CopB [Phenylobacterium zucineum]